MPPKGPALTTSFTTDASAALAGPDWLRARRVAAAEAFAAADLPSTDDEVWRYGRVDELDLAAYTPALDTQPDRGGDPGQLPAATRALGDAVPDAAAVLGARSGRVVASRVSEAAAAAGLRVGPAGDEHAGVLGAAVGVAPDVFFTLNDALTVEPVVVDVPAGATVPGAV